MHQLQAIQVDEDTVIYVEATEGLNLPPSDGSNEEEGNRRQSKGWSSGGSASAHAAALQSFKAIETTIKTYTQYTLNAFRDASMADVKRVSLEFGVNVSGVGGIPYIATGTAGCNIKVTVECSFPERNVPGSSQS